MLRLSTDFPPSQRVCCAPPVGSDRNPSLATVFNSLSRDLLRFFDVGRVSATESDLSSDSDDLLHGRNAAFPFSLGFRITNFSRNSRITLTNALLLAQQHASHAFSRFSRQKCIPFACISPFFLPTCDSA